MSPSRRKGAKISSRSASGTLARGRPPGTAPASPIIGYLTGEQSHGGAVGAVPHGVGGDVGDDPFEQSGVGVDERQVVGHAVADPVAGNADQRPMHHLVHRDGSSPTHRHQDLVVPVRIVLTGIT